MVDIRRRLRSYARTSEPGPFPADGTRDSIHVATLSIPATASMNALLNGSGCSNTQA
jgi:hypothetical protein